MQLSFKYLRQEVVGLMIKDQANIDFVEKEPRMAPVTCLMIGRLLVQESLRWDGYSVLHATFHGSQSRIPNSKKPPAHVC